MLQCKMCTLSAIIIGSMKGSTVEEFEELVAMEKKKKKVDLLNKIQHTLFKHLLLGA